MHRKTLILWNRKKLDQRTYSFNPDSEYGVREAYGLIRSREPGYDYRIVDGEVADHPLS